MAGGGGKPSKGAEELGEATEDIGEGGSDGTDIGSFFQGRGVTSLIIWGRDVGSHLKDGAGVEWVSTRGGEEAYRETGVEREERRVAPKSSTCCITALKKVPDIRAVAPSLHNILCSLPLLLRAFDRFPATAGQSSSPAVITLPRVAMYCATVFCLFAMDLLISISPASRMPPSRYG